MFDRSRRHLIRLLSADWQNKQKKNRESSMMKIQNNGSRERERDRGGERERERKRERIQIYVIIEGLTWLCPNHTAEYRRKEEPQHCE